MFHRCRSSFCCLWMAAFTLASGFSAHAQNPPLYSPIMFINHALRHGTVTAHQARLDGSDVQEVTEPPGTLSWHGVPGRRFFLRAEIRRYDSAGPNDVVVYDESGNERMVLSGAQDIRHSVMTWSKDSRRVVYYGRRFDKSRQIFESGLYVGDVVYSGGIPSEVINERLVVPDIAPTKDAQGNVTDYSFLNLDWMRDGKHLCYAVKSVIWSAAGSYVSKRYDVWVAQVGVWGSKSRPVFPIRVNLPNLPATHQYAGFTSAASPVEDKIALGTFTEITGTTLRFDIFVADVPAKYAGAPVMASQLTNSRNARNTTSMNRVAWSPDGDYIYWDGYPSSITFIGIYKIAADGSTGQIDVRSDTGQYNALREIRP